MIQARASPAETTASTSMKPFDPEGKMGPSKNVPDAVTMVE